MPRAIGLGGIGLACAAVSWASPRRLSRRDRAAPSSRGSRANSLGVSNNPLLEACKCIVGQAREPRVYLGA